MSFSDGEVQYKTAKASNEFDLFMHVVEGQFGSFRVMLSPSVGYNPSATPAMLKVLRSHNEPPPRKMGSSGYAILQSHDVQMSYVWDEPGTGGNDVKASDGDVFVVFLDCLEISVRAPCVDNAVSCPCKKRSISRYVCAKNVLVFCIMGHVSHLSGLRPNTLSSYVIVRSDRTTVNADGGRSWMKVNKLLFANKSRPFRGCLRRERVVSQ